MIYLNGNKTLTLIINILAAIFRMNSHMTPDCHFVCDIWPQLTSISIPWHRLTLIVIDTSLIPSWWRKKIERNWKKVINSWKNSSNLFLVMEKFDIQTLTQNIQNSKNRNQKIWRHWIMRKPWTWLILTDLQIKKIQFWNAKNASRNGSKSYPRHEFHNNLPIGEIQWFWNFKCLH